MIRFAFKEWAAICRALAEGRQEVILRKGGIAEEGGVFKPEHARFWLYPTFVHQQRDGVKPEAAALVADASSAQNSAGTSKILQFSHFVEVTATYFVRHLEDALAIDKLHLWSETTVRQRFAYRTPGLYVLAVRTYQLPVPFKVPFMPEYDGCKTWVDLGHDWPTEGATPVMETRKYADLLEELEKRLNPTAFA